MRAPVALAVLAIGMTTVAGAAPRLEAFPRVRRTPAPTAFGWSARVASEAHAVGARPRLGATELAAIVGRGGATAITAIALHRAKRPIGLWWLVRAEGRFDLWGPPGTEPFVSPTAYFRIVDRTGLVWGFGVP